MEYTYNNVKVSDLAVTATRISRLLGIMPRGISDSGDTTTIIFPGPISDVQKTVLDNFMAGTDIDKLPTTINTVYKLADIEAVKTATGLDFDIYPTDTGLIIQFQKILTTQEKNAFRGAVTALLTIL